MNGLQRLKNNGVEIHARSIFLQGLLVQAVETLPQFFDPIRDVLRRWEGLSGTTEADKIGNALAFANSTGLIDTAIIGVRSQAELLECISANNSATEVLVDYSYRLS